MSKSYIDPIASVPDLYSVCAFRPLRKTAGIVFDCIDPQALPNIDAIDRVFHTGSFPSPGPVGSVERPWYMHPHQADHLIVLAGERTVEIYTPAHGQVETFVVNSDAVYHNGQLIADGGAFLVWPRYVFHRVQSDPARGSASVNLATHYEGFDIRTNFNIYDLDTQTGEYRVIRQGHLDQ